MHAAARKFQDAKRVHDFIERRYRRRNSILSTKSTSKVSKSKKAISSSYRIAIMASGDIGA
jgi:hypothetical protein